MTQSIPRHEANKQNLKAILDEVARLLRAGLSLEQFFTYYCSHVASIEGVEYFGVLVRRGEEFKVIMETGVPVPLAEITVEFRQRIVGLWEQAWQQRRRLTLPAGSPTEEDPENPTPYSITIQPVVVGTEELGSTEGLLYMASNPAQLNGRLETIEKFLELSAGYISETMRMHRIKTIEEGFQKWQIVASMMTEVAGQMDVSRLALSVATRARELANCDRCAVVGRPPGGDLQVLAISNVSAPNPRSAQVKSILMLADDTLEKGGGPQLYRKGSEKIEVLGQIGDYFYHSRSQEVLSMPMSNRSGQKVGTLICESDQMGAMDVTSQHMAEVAATLAGPALGTVMEYASIPGLKLLKRYHDWRLSSETKKKRKLFFRWGVPVLILFLILLLPWPLNYSFKCHIRPEVYKSLIVEVAGSVSEVLVDGGAMVKKGEVIARLDDSETLQQWHIAQSEAERMHAQADIDKAGDNPLLAQLSDLKADQAAERAGFLKKQKEKTLLRSPVDGTVLSYDLKRRVGDLLVPGSIFAEVGNLSSWKVQMDVPESEISRLVALIKKQTPLDLAFSLNPLPGKTFHARISGLASVSQTAQVNDLRKNIFRVDAVVEVTPSEGDLLKSGYMGTAKLRGGWRPVGVILLGRFFDYLRLSFVI